MSWRVGEMEWKQVHGEDKTKYKEEGSCKPWQIRKICNTNRNRGIKAIQDHKAKAATKKQHDQMSQ